MKKLILQLQNFFYQPNKINYLTPIFQLCDLPIENFISFIDEHWLYAKSVDTSTILKSNAHLAIIYAIKYQHLDLLKALIQSRVELDHIADWEEQFISSFNQKPYNHELSVFLFEYNLLLNRYNDKTLLYFIQMGTHFSFQYPEGLSFIQYLQEKNYLVDKEELIILPHQQTHLNHAYNGYKSSVEQCCQSHNYEGLRFLFFYDVDILDDLDTTSYISSEMKQWITNYADQLAFAKSLDKTLSRQDEPNKPKAKI